MRSIIGNKLASLYQLTKQNTVFASLHEPEKQNTQEAGQSLCEIAKTLA